jgi:hypothetical protein
MTNSFNYADDRYRTMFANYGLAALRAQMLEKQLAVLLTAIPRIGGSTLEVAEFYRALDGYEKPMGHLLKVLKAKMTIPEDFEGILEKTLRDRNYLIHRFFKSKGILLGDVEATPALCAEIIAIGDQFLLTIRKLDEVLEKLQKIVEVPISQIEHEAKELFKL